MKEIVEFSEGLCWQLDEEGGVTLGFTQSALDQAGAISALDASDVGDEFEAGDWVAEIRGKNAVIDLVAPCPMRIVERNEEVLEQPALIEDDPTGDAWILRGERLDG